MNPVEPGGSEGELGSPALTRGVKQLPHAAIQQRF